MRRAKRPRGEFPLPPSAAPTGISAPPPALASAALRHWQAMRGPGDIQSAPLPQWTPPAPSESWLTTFFTWLSQVLAPVAHALGAGWPLVKWGMIAMGVAGVAALIWHWVAPLVDRWRRRQPAAAEAEIAWAPARAEAEALLADADALAAEGRFDEATHLLLRRSVAQIVAAAPHWLVPANTAREIAAMPHLPAMARAAFAIISSRVEASRFALRPLALADWQAARGAYADFALQRLAA